MKVHDILVGGAFCALGVAMIGYSYTFPTPRHLQYGPGLFPRLMGGGLALTGALIAINAALAHRRATDRPAWLERDAWLSDRALVRNVLLVPVACLFYFFAAGALGFLLTGSIILAVMFYFGGVAPIRSAVIAIGITAVANIFFASILHVPLPWGPLTPVSGYLIW